MAERVAFLMHAARHRWATASVRALCTRITAAFVSDVDRAPEEPRRPRQRSISPFGTRRPRLEHCREDVARARSVGYLFARDAHVHGAGGGSGAFPVRL